MFAIQMRRTFLRLREPLTNQHKRHIITMSAKPGSQQIAEETPSSTSSVTTTSETAKDPLLALPAFSGEGSTHTTTLDVSTGEGVKLDHLGPMVVNTDGSLSRISNWERMSDFEKKNTLRIIGKRNQTRLEALKTES